MFPDMSVEENLLMGTIPIGMDHAEEDMQRMFELFPRLKERRNQRAMTMSGGEQQMLAIARALMSRPKLLLLDEPSLGLAPIVVKQIFQTLRELARSGMTIFLVEQNANHALKLSDLSRRTLSAPRPGCLAAGAGAALEPRRKLDLCTACAFSATPRSPSAWLIHN